MRGVTEDVLVEVMRRWFVNYCQSHVRWTEGAEAPARPLSRILGIDHATISLVISGKRRPSIGMLCSASEATGVKMSVILEAIAKTAREFERPPHEFSPDLQRAFSAAKEKEAKRESARESAPPRRSAAGKRGRPSADSRKPQEEAPASRGPHGTSPSRR